MKPDVGSWKFGTFNARWYKSVGTTRLPTSSITSSATPPNSQQRLQLAQTQGSSTSATKNTEKRHKSMT